jgi:transcriptional regulator with XRE-family HTH domain
MKDSSPARRRVRLASNPLSRIGQRAGFSTALERATALGVSRSYLLQVERGAHLPSPRLIESMAKAYKHPAELLEKAALAARLMLARRILEQSEAE